MDSGLSLFANDTDSGSLSPLFNPHPDFLFELKEGTKKYVKMNEKTKKYSTQPAGFLGIREIESEHPPTICVGPERDISGSVNSSRPIHTMPLGLKYPDGSMGGMIVIKDAIVEYRSNIGVESKRSTAIPGRPSKYMGTYAYIGIPEDVFCHLQVETEAKGIPITLKDVKDSNGYVWMNANIAASTEPQGYIVEESGTRHDALVRLLAAIKANLIGNVGITCTLKRVGTDPDGTIKRTFGFSLKMMQVRDVTDICSPPLDGNDVFSIDDSTKTSPGLVSRLSRLSVSASAGTPSAPKVEVTTLQTGIARGEPTTA